METVSPVITAAEALLVRLEQLTLFNLAPSATSVQQHQRTKFLASEERILQLALSLHV
jgi:hypothetical protein